MPEATCVEERAKFALADVFGKLHDAQAALEDWRMLYGQRYAISKRSGEVELARLANINYDKINKLVSRTITLIGKVEQVQTLLEKTDQEING